MQVTLRRNRKTIAYYVHRLVYEAFNGPIPEGMHVNHKNEDKTDNKLDNLNLLSQQDNNGWGTRNERIRQNNIKTRGVRVAQLTTEGKLIKIWAAQKEAARVLGICATSISSCCNKKPWFKTAGGYRWEKIITDKNDKI